MARPEYDCKGIVVGPWTTGPTPMKLPVGGLPYFSVFAAAVWRVPPTKNEPRERFFWSAGPYAHGPASDIEDGKVKAEASLQEQGFINPMLNKLDEMAQLLEG